jgi:hypothetical protein
MDRDAGASHVSRQNFNKFRLFPSHAEMQLQAASQGRSQTHMLFGPTPSHRLLKRHNKYVYRLPARRQSCGAEIREGEEPAGPGPAGKVCGM